MTDLDIQKSRHLLKHLEEEMIFEHYRVSDRKFIISSAVRFFWYKENLV